MVKTVTVKSEIFNKCRICLEEGSIAIFNGIFTNFSISENISLISGIAIQENDIYPKHVCEPCLTALQTAVAFRNTARHTYEILRECNLVRSPIQLEMSFTEDYFDQSDADINLSELSNQQPCPKMANTLLSEDFQCNVKKSITDTMSKDLILTAQVENEEKHILTTGHESDINSSEFSKNNVEPDDAVLCKICNKSVLQRYWNHHCTIHKQSVNLTEKCKICNHEAVNFTALYAHVQSTHVKKKDTHTNLSFKHYNNNLDAKAGQLGKKEKRKQTLKHNHEMQYNDKLVPSVYAKFFKTTSDSNRVECMICNRNILSKGRKDHYAMHDPESENRYKCATCKKGFRYSNTYKHHKIDCDGNNFSSLSEIATSKHKPIVCKFCPRRFCHKKNLAIHNFNIHGIKITKAHYMPEYRKYYKRFLSNNVRMAQCLICHSIIKEKTFYSHFRFLHTEQDKEKYLCDVCGKKFIRKMNYVIHLSIHSNDFKFKCKLCPYKGRNRGLLNSHMRIHNRKNYQCDICSKICHHKSNIIRHIRHHSEPKIECKVCGKKFKENNYLTRHMNSIHLGRNRVHPCDKCDKVYASRKFMLQHKLKVHGVKASDNSGVHHRAHCKMELLNVG